MVHNQTAIEGATDVITAGGDTYVDKLRQKADEEKLKRVFIIAG